MRRTTQYDNCGVGIRKFDVFGRRTFCGSARMDRRFAALGAGSGSLSGRFRGDHASTDGGVGAGFDGNGLGAPHGQISRRGSIGEGRCGLCTQGNGQSYSGKLRAGSWRKNDGRPRRLPARRTTFPTTVGATLRTATRRQHCHVPEVRSHVTSHVTCQVRAACGLPCRHHRTHQPLVTSLGFLRMVQT
jgi:hypothetical protein